jgi:mycoredoxin
VGAAGSLKVQIIDSGPSPVVMYWRPGCPYCFALRRRLRQLGVTTTEVNIWDDRQAASLVRSYANGCETVPTVAIGSSIMVNPTGPEVLDAARRLAPHAVIPSEASNRPRRPPFFSAITARLRGSAGRTSHSHQ